MTSFPYKNPFLIEPGLALSAPLVHQHVTSLLTDARRKKIFQVVEDRCFSIPIVLEGIYDRGNISAVMRSGEAFGFCNYHVIETQERFKEANRVTQGADKWIETKKWKKTSDCVQHLKKQGYRICTTSLNAKKLIQDIDWSVPSALVLGNEKDGVSDEILAASDETFIIPMSGFVQSFNISVAGALCLYQIWLSRCAKLGRNGDLTVIEKEILAALYALRTQDSGAKVLREKVARGEIQNEFLISSEG